MFCQAKSNWGALSSGGGFCAGEKLLGLDFSSHSHYNYSVVDVLFDISAQRKLVKPSMDE
jgi:hypothetical protein